MKIDYYIGIDTGVNTGYAIWDKNANFFKGIFTYKIHEAMFEIAKMKREGLGIKVRIEDARKRKWVTGGREKAQGVGSVKRDAQILEDFCKDYGIDYEMVAPKNNKTKLSAPQFERLTGWKFRTSSHSRDAAMLVFGY